MSGKQRDERESAGPVDATQLERVLAARERLLHVLADIAGQAAAQSLVRCPYRTRDDVCTFRGPCRNARPQPHGTRLCAGGTLDPAPPAAEALDAAIADLERADDVRPDADHRNPGTGTP